ncbi:MAG: phosphotransferase [Methylococcales bacterium]
MSLFSALLSNRVTPEYSGFSLVSVVGDRYWLVQPSVYSTCNRVKIESRTELTYKREFDFRSGGTCVIVSETDQRLLQLMQWLEKRLGTSNIRIEPASSDASFRRYFRVFVEQKTLIAMDAPPPQENVSGFVAVSDIFRDAGVHVPEIIASDYQSGFLLLSDFGHQCYFDQLSEANADQLYADAFDALLQIQTGVATSTNALPVYDASLLQQELDFFSQWFVEQLLGLVLTTRQHQIFQTSCQRLVNSALEQPRVCVHRDFHSRNLMVLDTNNPGVIDFQDAVIGPLTYDLVSLLRDCYISWPVAKVDDWRNQFYQRSLLAGVFTSAISQNQYQQWFDKMGVQRHLKAIGIFSRLNIRDGKLGYLKDIPTTINYVVTICEHDAELAELSQLLNQVIVPAMQTHPEFQS